jgi:hypothetical protein
MSGLPPEADVRRANRHVSGHADVIEHIGVQLTLFKFSALVDPSKS